MFRLAALPFAILAGIALLATPADAASVHVSIQPEAFSPKTVTVSQGATVIWTNTDGIDHTSTSNDGFWDSGHIMAGHTFSVTFRNAGNYSYLCTIHGFTGTVRVPMKKSGSAGGGWTVRWSSASSAAGHNFDVQIKRPGQSMFASFRSGTTALKAFVNPAKAGTYKFRSRTRITSSGNTSGFSPVLTLSIS
jgi:plastocyanin